MRGQEGGTKELRTRDLQDLAVPRSLTSLPLPWAPRETQSLVTGSAEAGAGARLRAGARPEGGGAETVRAGAVMHGAGQGEDRPSFLADPTDE